MTREEIYRKIVDLSGTHNNLVLSWATSVGKSRGAIELLGALECSSAKVLLLVAEKAHKKNWLDEFDRWHLDTSRFDITIECYASLKKYRNTSWDVVIADEAHHLGSESRLDILSTMHIGRTWCLSATMKRDTIDSLSLILGSFVTHRVSMQESIENNILAEPSVYIIRLFLDNTRLDCEVVEEWGKKEKRVAYTCRYRDRFKFNRTKYPDIELHIKCTQLEKYDILSTQYEYWGKRYMISRQEFARNKWLRLGSERKRFLGECKTEYARNIISRKGGRFICFCTSIEQAETLGGENAIHSKVRNPQKIVDEFNSGKRDSIFAINMLQEGMNLKNLEWGMIVQLDGCERGWIQKTGRMMRSDNPVVYILYFDNTRDEAYLKNVIEGISEKYIRKFEMKQTR